MLIRHRATKVNAQTRDKTTPLILAGRLALEDFVEELVKADANLDLADENGGYGMSVLMKDSITFSMSYS